MPLERHIEVFEERAAITGGLHIGRLWERLRGEFLDEFERLDRQGIVGDELGQRLEAFLEGLSRKPETDLARMGSSVSYNQGRNVAILDAVEKGMAQFVVRSEVLDTNTCPECESLDGEAFDVNTPDYERHMPPAFCLGGDRCRGFYILIDGGEQN